MATSVQVVCWTSPVDLVEGIASELHDMEGVQDGGRVGQLVAVRLTDLRVGLASALYCGRPAGARRVLTPETGEEIAPGVDPVTWDPGHTKVSTEPGQLHAAVQLIAVRGRPIDYQTFSFDDQRSALIAAGGPEAWRQVNSQVLKLFFRGDSDWVTDDVSHILGRPARSFRDLAVEHAPDSVP